MTRETKLKRWKTGKADEPWKVRVIEADIEDANRMVGWLTYILLPDARYMEFDFTSSLNEMRKLSGNEIVDALIKYRDSRRNAL